MSVRSCEGVRAARILTLVGAVTALSTLHCGSADSSQAPAAGSGSGSASDPGSGGQGSTGTAGGHGGSEGGNGGNSSSSAGAGAAGSGGTVPEPARPSSLIVVGSDGAMIWDDADALDADVAPDVSLSGEVAGARAVVVDDDRLAVVTNSQLLVFDGAASLWTDGAPKAVLDLPELSPTLGGVARAAVDGDGDLWLTLDGSILLYPGFGSLQTADLPSATFFHEWGQIASMTYSTSGDHLFAAQVSGAGILHLASAKTAGNEVELESSWTDTSCWGTALADGILYCAQNAGTVTLWDARATAGPPKATLTSGLDSPLELVVMRDTLLVLDQDAVLLYRHASSLTSAAEPDVRIEEIGSPRRAWLSQSDSLYVLTTRVTDSESARSIVIYDDIFGSPQLRTELQATGGEDLWLLE